MMDFSLVRSTVFAWLSLYFASFYQCVGVTSGNSLNSLFFGWRMDLSPLSHISSVAGITGPTRIVFWVRRIADFWKVFSSSTHHVENK